MELEHDSIRFSLHPVPPFRLDWTVWALRRRPINTVDRWDGSTYQRAITVGEKPVLVAVTQRGTILRVAVTGKKLPAVTRRTVTSAIERLLGIRLDLSGFYAFSSGDTRLNKLATQFRGMKPPRFATVFEGLVNGISCQQLSITAGITFLNRLAERCGPTPGGGVHAFPCPQDLAGMEIAGMRELGYSGSKARTIIELAESVAAGWLDLEGLIKFDNAQCVDLLSAIKGIGRWTAEYTLLRGMGRTDVFPGDDVGARNSLTRWLHLRKKLDYQRVEKVLGKWTEYGGLIFLHLLLKGLSEGGNRMSIAGAEHCLPGIAAR